MQTTTRAKAMFAAAIVSSVALVGCGSPDARRAIHMQRGEQFFDAGNLQKAQVEFRSAMQIAPGRADARVMSGEVAEKLGDIGNASALYKSAIDLDSGYAPARVRLGRLYVFAGAPDRALDVIRPALLQHPDDPDLLAARGAARASLKDHEGALADVERAVRLAPQNEDAVALLVALYQREGQTGQAVDLLRRTLDRRPRSTPLHQVLANLYEGLGEMDLAEAQFAQIVALEPQQFAPRYVLASFDVRAGRLDAAERVLKEAITELPADEQPKLAYVEFLAKQRSAAESERAISDLIVRDLGDLDLLLVRGALYQQENQPAAAAAAYQDVINRAGDRPQGLAACDRLAAILIAQRRFDEASTLVGRVLVKSERDPSALELRANISLERGETAAAVTDLRTVLRDQPRSVLILRALARAYSAGGQVALAEETLRNAQDVDPQNTATRLELAQLLAQTNRQEVAIASLEETIVRFPAELEPREAIVRLYIAKSDLDAAGKAADEATSTAPQDWRGPYLQALVAEAQERPFNAERALERALAIKPAALEALEEISRLQISNGRGDRAVARVESLVASRPDDAALRNLLGELLVSTKEPMRAVEELTRATELAPEWWVPYHRLGSLQLSSGDPASAIRTYERGIAATRMELALVADLGTLYEQQGRAADAIRSYEAFCRAFPGIPSAANNLAMLLVTYDKDPASLQRARDLTSPFMTATNPDLLDTAGWVRFKSGDVMAALPVLEEAARLAPDSHIVQYHLGMAQLQAGQRERARASLESALAGSARFSGWDEARSALARLKS